MDEPSSIKDDPLRWNIGTLTQHILLQLREMCYAGSTLEAAHKLVAEGKIEAPGDIGASKKDNSKAPND